MSENNYLDGMTAFYIIGGDAATMRDRMSMSDATGYVGFKLVGIIACSAKESMPSPTIAAEYLERLHALLLELSPRYACMEVQRMLAKTEEMIGTVNDSIAQQAVRRLLD
jgi:hypothetical protein